MHASPGKISQASDTNAVVSIDMSDRVKDYVAIAQQRMPEGIHLTVWQDDSTTLRSRRDTLLENGTAAFFLVLLLLAADESGR